MYFLMLSGNLNGETHIKVTVYAGGLIGYNNGDVINSTANGTVSASGYNSEYTHKGNIFGFNSKA